MRDWSASDYNQQSTLQQAMAEEQLRLLTLAGNERVLDVGCGDGKITAEIARRLPQGSVLGVDPSPSMIAFASSHFGQPIQANLHFEVADARRLGYRNEFDLVVSFNALHWVPEQEAALRSIRESLKASGRALLRLVPQGSRQSIEDVIEEVRQDRRWAQFFEGFRKPYAHFTPKEYQALARRAGLQVQDLRVEDKAWDFHSRPGFLAFCRATCALWTGRLPEGDVDAFLTEILDRYRSVAADTSQEANTFKFYQMEVALAAGR